MNRKLLDTSCAHDLYNHHCLACVAGDECKILLSDPWTAELTFEDGSFDLVVYEAHHGWYFPDSCGDAATATGMYDAW